MHYNKFFYNRNELRPPTSEKMVMQSSCIAQRALHNRVMAVLYVRDLGLEPLRRVNVNRESLSFARDPYISTIECHFH